MGSFMRPGWAHTAASPTQEPRWQWHTFTVSLGPGSFVLYKHKMQPWTLLCFPLFSCYGWTNFLFIEVFLRILRTLVTDFSSSAGHQQLQWLIPTGFPCTSIPFQFSGGEGLAEFVSAHQVSIHFFARNKLKLCSAMSCGRELSLETACVRWLKHLIIVACIIDCCALHCFQICASYYTAQYIQS